MDREEIKQIAYDFTTSKGDAKKLEDRILSLFGVIYSEKETKALCRQAYTQGKHKALNRDYSLTFSEWCRDLRMKDIKL